MPRLDTLAFALAAAGFVAITGCTGTQTATTTNAYVDDTEPADVLYNQALANMDAGNLKEARKKFAKIDRQHPYSVHGRKAIVMQTFIAYRSKDYETAIASGKRFVSQFPSDKEAAYMQYLVGMSHHRQIIDVTRDQKAAARARKAFTTLVERYPDSEYVPDAKKKIRMARDQLAGKSMQVGRYYQERREHLAAVNRFRRVVEKDSDTRHVEEALFRLTESYLALGLVSEAQTAAAVLGHNYPDSRWYKDAYALLGKGGYKPDENRGSWISRAAKRLTGRA